jgi:hypothetical protein
MPRKLPWLVNGAVRVNTKAKVPPVKRQRVESESETDDGDLARQYRTKGIDNQSRLKKGSKIGEVEPKGNN